MRRILGMLALAVAACDRPLDISAPPPDVVDDAADTLVARPPSVVESEIRYGLAPALAALEKAVPRTFGDIARRLPVASNKRLHVAFAARRSPFVIAVDSQRVTVSSVVEYEGRGWYKPPIGPEISAACGTGNVPKPRTRVRLESTLSLQESWQLAARTRVARVAPYSTESRDKCAVTIFRIDVTERVMKATRDALEQEVRTLDRALAAVQTRARFERWWRDISRPIRLTDSIYLTLNPRRVQLGGIRVDSGVAVASLRLEAAPRIATGDRPNDFELFTPLPPLTKGALAGRGMHVALDGTFGYDVATGLLRRALTGRTLTWARRRITIRDVTLSGIGGGRVALGVRFDGAARGLVYLTGTPRYDNAQDQLLIPDLGYDLRTTSLLVKGVAFLGDNQIRDLLRQNARFPLQGHLDQLRVRAERGMNRNLAEGVALVAALDKVQDVTVRARRDAIHVRADASGTIRLDIDRPLAVTRQAAPATRAR
ncbi:MAG TPA: DUF4403 family protein [Gemmatimonadaceae bacterium]|nr:DUF4403 family protein [Gemmatimonadaceae bacterium]